VSPVIGKYGKTKKKEIKILCTVFEDMAGDYVLSFTCFV
jgi:hypothetical protein